MGRSSPRIRSTICTFEASGRSAHSSASSRQVDFVSALPDAMCVSWRCGDLHSSAGPLVHRLTASLLRHKAPITTFPPSCPLAPITAYNFAGASVLLHMTAIYTAGH